MKRSDLEITHLKGSGPGGQNRNKRMSGVRITHVPTGLTVISTERRSQAQNLSYGLERLEEKLAKHFHRPRKRRPTQRTHGSVERRLHSKGKASLKKAQRRSPRDSD